MADESRAGGDREEGRRPGGRGVGPDETGLTYRDAGVDRRAATAAKSRIRELVRSTFTDGVLGDFGAFGGCFRLDLGHAGGDGEREGVDATAVEAPVLVASADGVGTKLKVAVRAGIHDTVGYDLVAHCADDILTQGALPLFFLDYLALGEMEGDVVEEVVAGVARACREVGAALLGGETAEMPDVYHPGEYDLAGFIVGRTVGPEPLDGSAIEPGDRLLALASDGLHTNGFTLVRRILFEQEGWAPDRVVEEWGGRTVAGELLRPHRAYVGPLSDPLRRGEVLGLAHVTGGGLPDNLPRMLPEGCGARIDPDGWTVPPVFTTLQRLGGIPEEDMWDTFNMGVGMVAAVRDDAAPALAAELEAAGEEVWTLGTVVEGDGVVFEAGSPGSRGGAGP